MAVRNGGGEASHKKGNYEKLVGRILTKKRIWQDVS